MKRFWITVLLIVVLSGCGTEQQSKVSEITVARLDKAGFEKLVQQRNGKLLLLHVWATWSAPSEKEMPQLAALARELDPQRIDFASISADFPDEIESKIRPFLARHDVPFPNYVEDFTDNQDFIDCINPDWEGGLPVTVIYDRDGTQLGLFPGAADFKAIRHILAAHI